MALSSKLIPTVITDRNGKTTTVYKKPTDDPRDTKSAAISSISIRIANQTLDNQVDEIIATLNRVSPPDIMNADRYRVERTISRLRTFFNHEQVAAIHSVVHTFVDGDYPKDPDFTTLLWLLDTNLEDGMVSIVNNHREYLNANEGSLNSFIALTATLQSILEIKVDDQGRLPTIEAHMKAQTHFEESANSPRTGPYARYAYNQPYIEAVEKHWNYVDAIISYVDQRGIMHPSLGATRFDLKHFEESLEHGPVSNGWL